MSEGFLSLARPLLDIAAMPCAPTGRPSGSTRGPLLLPERYRPAEPPDIDSLEILPIVIARLVRAIHGPARAESWIARTDRSMTKVQVPEIAGTYDPGPTRLSWANRRYASRS